MMDTNENKKTYTEIIFVNYILDNVHGFIGLTDMENKIEKLPIFKRLQDISQLGLVKRIFPCALHNRYIHSLGVMHIIDQMALHLKVFSSAERQLLRLAGMLHDLGHYPLSHDLEQVYDRKGNMQIGEHIPIKESFSADAAESINKIMREESIAESPTSTDNIQKPRRKLLVKNPFHHETITVKVIQSSTSIRNIIIDGIKNGNFDDSERKPSKFENKNIENFATKIIRDICALIQGDGDYIYKDAGAFPKYFTAMIQMLHSELDADRIDYLLRDATFSGAAYGSFDIGLLLQNLAMREYTIGEEHVWIVGVKEKGIGCADQYMMNRYLAYTQVIFHKYTSIIGKMLREVVLWMMNHPGFSFYDGDTVVQIIKQHEKTGYYYAFTDSYFFNRLDSITKEDGCPDDVYYFVEQLKNFRSLNVKFEDVFSGDTSHQKEHIEKTDCYKYLMSLDKNKDFRNVDGLYLFDNKKLTYHVPVEIFEKNYNAYNETHKESPSEDDLFNKELEKSEFDKHNKFLIDRLMDGLAVISDNENIPPCLLIDTPRSITRQMFDMRQLILRKYIYINS